MSASGAPVAIVTGGGRGIGRAIAEYLHRSGYRVVVADSGIAVDGRSDASDDGDLIAERPSEGLHLRRCDVRDLASARALAAECVENLGGIDVLVNVAGISRPARIADGSLEDLHAVLDVNVRGTCNMIEAVLPGMKARGGGSIVVTGSTAGFLGSRRQPSYSAAKEALLGLTYAMARRLAAEGIRVNALAPTGNSRMSKGMIRPDPPEVEGRLPASFFDHDPRHIAEFTELLCRSRFKPVTGRLFLVASGYLIEYERMRRLKTIGAVSRLAESGALADAMEWILAKPNHEEITPMPSREFVKRAPVKYWEGADELRTPRR